MHRLSLITQRLIQGIGLNQNSVRGKHNQIINHGTRANVYINIDGDNNYLEIGRGAALSNLVITIIGNNHRVIVEEKCFFKRGSIVLADTRGELIIGKNTTIEGASFTINEPVSRITVGRDCMLSNGIRICSSDAHSIIDRDTNRRTNYAGNVQIGDHVWIGAASIILKGVQIGDSAVIGAGSVVTRNVPSNCIAAGNPARIVRKNIDWTRELTYHDKPIEKELSIFKSE